MNKYHLIFIFKIIFPLSGFNQWVSQFSGTTNLLNNIHFSSPDTGYVCDDNMNIRRTTNGGITWNAYPQVQGYGTYFTSATTGFAFGADIYRTTNGGVTWTDVFSLPIGGLTSMDFVNPTTGFVAGWHATLDSFIVFKTIDSGKTWSRASAMTSPPYPTIDFIDSNTGFINENTGISRTSNGAATWTAQYADTINFSLVSDIDFPVHDTGYAVAIFGEILKSSDAGLTWIPLTTTNADPLYSVFFTDAKTGWAVGGNGWAPGPILKTTDGGANWVLNATAPNTLNSVYFVSPALGYACGNGGVIVKYTGTTGVNDSNTLSKGIISPNPSSGVFHINSPGEILILDLLGNEIFFSKLSGHSSEINISSHPKSIYFVRLKTASGEVFTEKVILH